LDVERHLESAYGDWLRFIRQNCDGPECDRIWHDLMLRKSALSKDQSVCALPKGQSPIATRAEEMEVVLVVSGSTDDRNGTWTMERLGGDNSWICSCYLLEEEEYGWRVTDLNSGEGLFWKDKQLGLSSEGAYRKCPTCKGEGVATVSLIPKRRESVKPSPAEVN
jgi:hypothetical protein